ncbi:MAG: hypothetical protein WEC59_05635 [Salibacteraceae bacterium]
MKTAKTYTEELIEQLGRSKPFLDDTMRARMVEMDEKMREVQREQKIIEKNSWESAAKVVLNS